MCNSSIDRCRCGRRVHRIPDKVRQSLAGDMVPSLAGDDRRLAPLPKLRLLFAKRSARSRVEAHRLRSGVAPRRKRGLRGAGPLPCPKQRIPVSWRIKQYPSRNVFWIALCEANHYGMPHARQAMISVALNPDIEQRLTELARRRGCRRGILRESLSRRALKTSMTSKWLPAAWKTVG